MIMFGPHVGISKTGEVGKYHRVGQATESGACGAVIAAYNQCCAGADIPWDKDDMQQSWLRDALGPRCQECKDSKNPLASFTHAAFDEIKAKMLRIVNTGYGSGKLVLLGGIQINMPKPFEDHFQPKFFTVMQAGAEPVDIMADLSFGN